MSSGTCDNDTDGPSFNLFFCQLWVFDIEIAKIILSQALWNENPSLQEST